jgi:hypothetical protein
MEQGLCEVFGAIHMPLGRQGLYLAASTQQINQSFRESTDRFAWEHSVAILML